MQFVVKSLSVISILLFTHQLKAQDDFSVGLGLGATYSGLGANVSLLSDSDMKYLSAGCLSYRSSGATCGVGIGWIKTDLFNARSNKHGLGVYLGAVGSQHTYRGSEAVNGLGFGYYYFFNGIANSGTNIGLTLVAGHAQNKTLTSAMLQIGYQF
jgi:hypothetical protein